MIRQGKETVIMNLEIVFIIPGERIRKRTKRYPNKLMRNNFMRASNKIIVDVSIIPLSKDHNLLVLIISYIKWFFFDLVDKKGLSLPAGRQGFQDSSEII
jgi:hypothetical protein